MRKMLSLAALAALAGCTVGPNYERPDVAVPPTYARPATAAASDVDVARWWTAFGDPRLTALIERALADNPTIRIAASRVRQARLEEIVARAAGRPQINLGANATRVEFSRNGGFASIARQFQGGQAGGGGLALPGTGITTYAIGFDASWELDLFGGARRQREAAVARAEAAEWSARDAGVTLAAEIADAYFALRLDQAQIALIEAEMAGRRRQIEIAEHQARAGLTPSIDTLRATGELTQARARIEPLRADAELRMHALGLLIGQPPEALIADLSAPGAALGAPPAVPAGLPSDLL
ncbi:MAG: TolC family protein, partial [Sphingomonas sp.]|nr:TolC family protein [Sphingomonas sp.]